MAQDTRNPGFRARERQLPARPAASASPAADPLAELARLIGRQNESSTPVRSSATQSGWSPPVPTRRPSTEFYPLPDPYAGQQPPETAADYRDPSYASGAQQDPYGHPQQGEVYADHAYTDGPRYDQQHYDEQAYGHSAEHQLPSGMYVDPRAGGYHSERYQSEYHSQTYGDPQAYSGYGTGHADPDSRDFPHSPQHSYDPHQGAPGSFRPPFGQQTSDHRKAPNKRGVVTVLAVLALAVVGTAGAYGYRAMFGNPGTAMPPPVIKADAKPNKIVPETDANAKPIQDRIGVKTERVVTREEQPVEIRDPARGGSRVIFPNLANQQPSQPAGPTIASLAAAATASPPTQTSPEAKKVRTVAIRPDAPAATASTRPAASGRAAAPEAERSTPLPLAPATQEPAPQRQAARTPASTGSPFPAPISGNSGNAGAYAVQVTSQRTEQEAQAAYKSLQGQFPSVLASRPAVVRRADLGDKGTYYRAQIPFSSQTEASEFCSSLKAAGGQCVVQRN